MEFMDIGMLADKRPSGAKVAPFAELRKMPRIELTDRLEVIQEPENIKRLEAFLSAGEALVPVTRRAPTVEYTLRKDFPRRFLFEMTSICNVLCSMCPRNDLLRPSNHVDPELYFKGVTEINARGVDGLWMYCLGESLMHPEFRRIMRFMEDKTGIKSVWFSTNGHLMNDSNVKFLLDSCVTFMNYSLNATSAKTYRAVNPKGDFEVVLNNLKRVIRYKAGRRKVAPFLRVQMIEQEFTGHEIQDFLERFYQEVDMVSVNMLEHANLPMNKFGLKQERPRSMPGYCSRLRDNRAIITANGAMTLCDFAYNNEERFVGQHYLGNIKDQTIYEIWNSERRRNLMKLEAEHRLKELTLCRDCEDFDISRPTLVGEVKTA